VAVLKNSGLELNFRTKLVALFNLILPILSVVWLKLIVSSAAYQNRYDTSNSYAPLLYPIFLPIIGVIGGIYLTKKTNGKWKILAIITVVISALLFLYILATFFASGASD